MSIIQSPLINKSSLLSLHHYTHTFLVTVRARTNSTCSTYSLTVCSRRVMQHLQQAVPRSLPVRIARRPLRSLWHLRRTLPCLLPCLLVSCSTERGVLSRCISRQLELEPLLHVCKEVLQAIVTMPVQDHVAPIQHASDARKHLPGALVLPASKVRDRVEPAWFLRSRRRGVATMPHKLVGRHASILHALIFVPSLHGAGSWTRPLLDLAWYERDELCEGGRSRPSHPKGRSLRRPLVLVLVVESLHGSGAFGGSTGWRVDAVAVPMHHRIRAWPCIEDTLLILHGSVLRDKVEENSIPASSLVILLTIAARQARRDHCHLLFGASHIEGH
mmetsp:Transcript_48225/g.151292  ORF Transcript_48225/g.151292 Transcript_48225/m.151292 type:complete len:331 (-) Transcript_48225:66-1058(-)